MCLWFENRCLNVFSVSPKYSFVLLLSGVTCALYITLVDRQLPLSGHCLRSLQLQDLLAFMADSHILNSKYHL